MLFHIHASWTNSTFMVASTHIFMFVFFRAKNLAIAFWFCTVHIAFTRLSVKIINTDNCVLFFTVDRNDKSFIKYITLSIPAFSLYFWIFSISDNATM